MERKLKITIPKPCHEDWNKMTPDATGKFCHKCETSVIDFTKMSAIEIQKYFIENKGKKICGKFNNKQLDKLIIKIPYQVLETPMRFHKMFLLALLMAMGTTLFSCQNQNGEKQKIDGVEIINSNENQKTHGLSLPSKKTDTVIDQEKPVVEIIKIPKHGKSNRNIEKTGEIAVVPVPRKVKDTIFEDNGIYGMPGITVYPEFIGGLKKFETFIFEDYKNSTKISDGIKVSFAVDKDGTLTDFQDIGKISSGNELITVLKKSPKWYPAEYNGKKQKVYFNLELKGGNVIELIRITNFEH